MQVKRYEQEELSPTARLRHPETIDLIAYWRDKLANRPDLAMLARFALIIHSTIPSGASVERLFSLCSIQLSKRRWRLSQYNLQDEIMVHMHTNVEMLMVHYARTGMFSESLLEGEIVGDSW